MEVEPETNDSGNNSSPSNEDLTEASPIPEVDVYISPQSIAMMYHSLGKLKPGENAYKSAMLVTKLTVHHDFRDQFDLKSLVTIFRADIEFWHWIPLNDLKFAIFDKLIKSLNKEVTLADMQIYRSLIVAASKLKNGPS